MIDGTWAFFEEAGEWGCQRGDPKPRRHEPWCPIGAKYYEETTGRKPYTPLEGDD